MGAFLKEYPVVSMQVGYEELNNKGPGFVTFDLVFYLEGKRKIYNILV